MRSGMALVLLAAGLTIAVPLRAAQAGNAARKSEAVRPEAAKVELRVSADGECSWSLDGESQGKLGANQAAEVRRIGVGDHRVEAMDESGNVVFSRTVSVGASSDSNPEPISVMLRVGRNGAAAVESRPVEAAAQVAEANGGTQMSERTGDAKGNGERGPVGDPAGDRLGDPITGKAAVEDPMMGRTALAGAERGQQRIPTAQGPIAGQAPVPTERLRARAEVYSDDRTGLMWLTRDEGAAMDYRAAEKFCNGLKAGGYRDWRLPRMAELEGIYDGEARQRLGANGAALRVEKEIALGQGRIWERALSGSGSDSGAAFDFETGRSGDAAGGEAGREAGALCVREGGK